MKLLTFLRMFINNDMFYEENKRNCKINTLVRYACLYGTFKLEYNFKEVFKLSRLSTIAQQFKTTQLSIILLTNQFFSDLSLLYQNSGKIKATH